MNKAIVIGSGVAGLASAIRLANQGFKVSVFETNGQAGGKINEIVADGYRFDGGPSLFTLPELVDELFTLSGKKPEDYFRYIRCGEVCRYFWKDGNTLNAWADTERFAWEVEQVFGEGERVKEYLQTSRKMYEATEGVFLKRSLHKLRSYFHPDVIKGLTSINQLHLTESLNDYNTKAFKDPHLVQLFNRFATYNGSNPFLTPGIMGMIPHLEHNLGTYFPEGGMYRIVQSLYKLATELGVEFHFNSHVEQIVVENSAAKGVMVKGEELKAEVVMCNTDIVSAYRKLLPHQPAPEKTLAQERSSSAMVFYWGMNRTFPKLGLHNIFFSKNYEREFDHIFKKHKIGENPTVYVNISSKVEPSDAPKGGENWFVMVNAPADTGQDWDVIKDQTRKVVISKLEKVLQRPVEEHIVWEGSMTPVDIAHKTGSYLGSLYGASSNDRMAAFLRHPNFSRKIKGLYFCGGSVHPGGGIPLALLSAKIACGLISDRL